MTYTNEGITNVKKIKPENITEAVESASIVIHDSLSTSTIFSSPGQVKLQPHH